MNSLNIIKLLYVLIIVAAFIMQQITHNNGLFVNIIFMSTLALAIILLHRQQKLTEEIKLLLLKKDQSN
ncbi:hypothetical protein [Algibacillus agarilyticus]|uniref:hypothetical protein n=1 Tax=Algibacillus agarilyticus TaxID=2234133 RepID=UPI000DD03839|nr:hypothetical protein [Algibacillus agarilyticus]